MAVKGFTTSEKDKLRGLVKKAGGREAFAKQVKEGGRGQAFLEKARATNKNNNIENINNTQSTISGTSGLKKVGTGPSPQFMNERGELTTGLTPLGGIKKPDVMGTTTKKDTTPEYTAPKDGTITSGTKGMGTTGISGEVTTPKDKTFEMPTDGVIKEEDLTGDYKTFYDSLGDTEKKLFLAVGENAMKKNLDIAEEYANYMRDYETTKSRKEADEEYRLKQEQISGEMADIRESQTIRRAKDGVNKLKQSIAYMGNLGMPGVSAQRTVNLENQVTEAEKSLRELDRLQSLAKRSRALGKEKSAQNFERQMEDITTKLNDNVDKAIQDTFNSLVKADNDGKLDTVEELTAFRDKMYKDLDNSITGFSDASIEQMQFLVKQVNQARKEAVEYEQNQNTVNQDLSAVRGYYVNNNGTPIYGANGLPIKTPTVIPEGFEPFVSNGKFFSPKMTEEGKLELDDNGSPIFTSTQLEDEVSLSSQLADAYLNMVNKGVMTVQEAIKAVPELAQNESFIAGLEDQEDTYDPDRYKYNAKTGSYFDTKTREFINEEEMGSTGDPIKSGEGDIVPGFGSGIITGYGSDANPYGLDVDGKIGDPLKMPEGVSGVVVGIGYDEDGWGNYVIIEDREGTKIQYSHLDQINVSEGDRVDSNNVFGTIGNTGYVVAGPGGDGSHVDITMTGADGNKLSAEEVARYHGAQKAGTTEEATKKAKKFEDVPLTFSRQIMSQVPTKLLDNVKELERLEGNVLKLYNEGYTPEEAVLAYGGFDISDEGNKPLAMSLVDVVRAIPDDVPSNYLSTFSNFINKGNDKGAIKYAEGIGYKEAKKRLGENFIPESDANFTIQTHKKIVDFIEKNQDRIGPLSGRWNKLKKQFANDSEFQALETLISGSLAEVRRAFAGSAVTESELKAIRDFAGLDTKMPIQNLLSGLQQNASQKMISFNNQREEVGLPRLSPEALTNFDERINLYRDMGVADEAVESESDPLGLGLGGETNNEDPLGLFK